MRPWFPALLLALPLGCDEGAVCGPGTTNFQGVCLAPDQIRCGEGTHLEGGSCEADEDGGGSGEGGQGEGGDGEGGMGPDLECGPGTHVEGNQCVPDDDGVVCGPGTFEARGECLPNGEPGAPGFYVLVATDQIPADGITKIPAWVFAVDEDGSPIEAPVIVAPSRPDAGYAMPNSFTLGDVGGETYFTPCNSAINGSCLGGFTLEVFLSSDLTTPVAVSAPLELVSPTGVGSPGPCEVSGNIIFFDGDGGDYIHPGIDTITLGSWSDDGQPDFIHIGVDPEDSGQGLWWDIELSSEQLGMPLVEQVYQGAERYPFEAPGHPGLSISGDGRGCNTLTGKFQIHDLEIDQGGVVSLLATFEQHCEGGTAALRGCVHYGL